MVRVADPPMKKLSAPSSEELQWLSSPRSSSLQLCLVALRSDSPVGSIAERRSSWSAHLQSCPGKDHSTLCGPDRTADHTPGDLLDAAGG